MPTNKNALTRYKYLDDLLSDRLHHYDIHDLTDKCNEMLYDAGLPEVTQRCIEKDIKFIQYEPFYAEIERFWSNGRRCIRYADQSYSIFKKELTEEECNLLQEVLNTIGQFDGLANFNWLDGLKYGLGLKERPKIISFSNNPYLQNSNLLGVLFDYISNSLAIKLEYHKFNEETSKDVLLHPYLLKQFNDRWYLIGAADDDDKILHFALDRIEKVTPMPDMKYRKCTQNLSKRFSEIIGVTLFEDRKVERILFWVNDHSKGYVSTKPLHESQILYKNKKDEELRAQYPQLQGGAFFSIDCMQNYELIRELSSFGRNLLVLSPDSIKQEIINRIKGMWDDYNLL